MKLLVRGLSSVLALASLLVFASLISSGCNDDFEDGANESVRVVNDYDEPITVRFDELSSGGFDVDRETRIIPPGETRRLRVFFEFGNADGDDDDGFGFDRDLRATLIEVERGGETELVEVSPDDGVLRLPKDDTRD